MNSEELADFIATERDKYPRRADDMDSEELSHKIIEWMAPRKPKTATSDTDLLTELRNIRAIWQERRYTGSRTPVQAGDLVAKELGRVIDALSQPVQVEVTEPEWEYGRVNGEYITIPPAGIPHTHRRIKAIPAGPWEQVTP